MKLKDFKKACNDLLSGAFNEQYPIYGTAVKDGYKRPSFFTELLPRSMRPLSRNITELGLTYKFTFLERTHSESTCLDIVATAAEAFGIRIRAAGKWFTIESYDYEFIDTNRDILQVTIDFAAVKTVTKKAGTEDLIREIDMDVEILSPNNELMARFDVKGD